MVRSQKMMHDKVIFNSYCRCKIESSSDGSMENLQKNRCSSLVYVITVVSSVCMSNIQGLSRFHFRFIMVAHVHALTMIITLKQLSSSGSGISIRSVLSAAPLSLPVSLPP